MQRNKQIQDKLREEQSQYDWKLKQIAAMNKREVPTAQLFQLKTNKDGVVSNVQDDGYIQLNVSIIEEVNICNGG